MKATQMIAGALIAFLSVAVMPLRAADHIAPLSEVRQRLSDREQARAADVDRLTQFFQSPQAKHALAKSGMDSKEVLAAVTLLDDESLESLAARAADAQQDLSAGALNNQQLTYVVIALGTAVLILVIIAA